MKRNVGWMMAALLMASLPGFAAGATRADAERDPVLKAMLAELDRNRAQLKLEGFEKPFFIEYRLLDVDHFETRAAFGASEGAEHGHQRVARVTVRVGDWKIDSSTPRGDGVIEMEAVEDDAVALRSVLWSATDQAYKQALASYAQKQAALKQVETPPQADDFSHETPVISLGETQRLDLDEQAWAERVTRATGLYRTDAAWSRDLRYARGGFRARATTTRLVNSEGTIVRQARVDLAQSVALGMQAADGMRLDRSYASRGTALADLDSEETFNEHAKGLLRSLEALRQAPLVEEEYHGPVLLAADAASGVFETLLGGAVVATRPKLGTEARTNGAFASSLHARVLPEFLDAVDDPTMKSFAGKGLLGAYAIDEEGVPAQAVELVKDGRLESYLIGREPVRDLPHSNGHGRAAMMGPAWPSIGVLKISAKDGLDEAGLNRRLLEMAKERDLKNAYVVETLGGKLTPRLLYRVREDGSRELVRGAALGDLDTRALRSSIVAAGKDLHVMNTEAEDLPETVLGPALLFDELTVKRANEKNDKLPYYPPPE